MIISLLLIALSTLASAETVAPIVVQSDLDKSDAPLVNAVGTFSVRDQKQIKNQSPNSLKSAINNEPNVSFYGSPRATAELPQIRGLGPEHILVLDEGVRQNFQSGHNGRLFSDFSLMERIEIVKGPWSSLYGSGALGGVINLRRSTAEDFIRRTGRDQGGELALDFATNAREFGQRATAYGKSGAITPLLSYRHTDSKDIRAGGGVKLPYSAEESQDLYSSTGFDLGHGQNFTLKLNHHQTKTLEPLNPELGDTAINKIGDAFSKKQDVVGDYQFARETFDLRAKPYYRRTEVDRSRKSDGRTDEQSVQTLGFDTWANVRTNWNDWLGSVLTGGVEYFHDRNIGRRNAAALGSFPDGTNNQIGLYLQPQLAIHKRWKLTPGARYDRFDYHSPGNAENQGKKISLKLYGSYDITPTSVAFLGWGQAYNAPRLQDLYASGLHFPGFPGTPNNFFYPNPGLRPERADTWEGGYRGTHDLGVDTALISNATAFLTRSKDFIFRDINQAAGTTYFRNLQQARLYGAELSFLLQRERWGAGLGYGRVRSRDQSTGQPLADTPADTWTGRYEYYFPRGISAGSDLNYVQAQTRISGETVRTAPYFTQDYYASYDRRPWNATLRVNNAYNRTYRRHFSVNPERGRDVRLLTSWAF